MTVLAIKHYKDRIEVATDSGTYWGGTGMKEDGKTKERRHCKILSPKTYLHFMGTGFLSETHLFELFCTKHDPETNTRHGILRFFSEFIKWKKEFTDKLEQNNAYFLIYQKIPYLIDGGFDIQNIEVGEFKTLGAGMQEAKCALYLGKTPKEAVELTLKLNSWTSGKVQELVIKK